jgi:putative phage-type endonuclease
MVFCDDVALVARTDNMTKERWLEIRRSGIGGSDAGAVCGFNRYKNAIDVWFDKTKKINDKKDNEAMRQGRDLEGYVAERFCEATGKKVYELPVMLGNVNYPYALADVDRLVDGEQAGLECKTANLYSEKRWAGGSIPPEYELQCHHYMMVTGAECWYIACLIYGRDFIWHKIERDE